MTSVQGLATRSGSPYGVIRTTGNDRVGSPAPRAAVSQSRNSQIREAQAILLLGKEKEGGAGIHGCGELLAEAVCTSKKAWEAHSVSGLVQQWAEPSLKRLFSLALEST